MFNPFFHWKRPFFEEIFDPIPSWDMAMLYNTKCSFLIKFYEAKLVLILENENKNTIKQQELR